MAVTLERLRGRVGDLDSHELIPCNQWETAFGEPGRRFIELNQAMFDRIAREIPPEDNLTADHPDTMSITEQTVWEKRGNGAPSASNMDRRPQVLDLMASARNWCSRASARSR